MSCKDCKYSPKTYEEYFMGGSCPDAFTSVAVNCGMFDQSNTEDLIRRRGGRMTRYGRMTKEEAIDILVGVIAANSEEENEALDMGIEALNGYERTLNKIIAEIKQLPITDTAIKLVVEVINRYKEEK